MAKIAVMYGNNPVTGGPWNTSQSSFVEPYQGNAFDNNYYRGPNNRGYQASQYGSIGNNSTTTNNVSNTSHSNNMSNSNANNFAAPGTTRAPVTASYPWNGLVSTTSSTSVHRQRPSSGVFGNSSTALGSWNSTRSPIWDEIEDPSPTNSVDDIITSPNLSEYSLENTQGGAAGQQSRPPPRGRPQRRPNNRDEFDGPHQFLARPSPDMVALQERELPHLPTNLLVQEQDEVLNKVNDRLSQCAYYFVAKYQFPIPLVPDMRTVEGPQDREWTEWVYLLKRLATKRRIPARVLYNGQIKQFVTVLENSLEMRHAAKHQSRPLKDDRNILQLISAGIQVAKILKDATAMEYLDHLYVSTEKQIAERAASRFM